MDQRAVSAAARRSGHHSSGLDLDRSGSAEAASARHFAAITEAQRAAIADDICSAGKAAPSFATAAKFFARFRDLTAGGFYTTPVGMKDIGYVGNVPLEKFDGPPLEVLKKARPGLNIA